jgi:hypothetical protein
MWILRKFYGNLPPTDPRMLAMTPELIELEFAHMALDRENKEKGDTYTDEEYDEWDNETEQADTRGSEEERTSEEGYMPESYPVQAENDSDEDWEDVETDDLDSE